MATDAGRSEVRVQRDGGGTNVDTGVPVLDHLLTLLARYARFGLALGIAPGSADAEVAAAGTALGEALAGPLRGVSDEPLLVSNVDLSEARIGGLASDLVSRFLRELAQGAGLTLHVRLVNGSETQHVLEAIFKALGVALAQACSTS